ncbi:hypothetical protein [Cupriavidus basilensis]|uniref:hypothetical protein n=1 Tax=Cupriavidus basilensis TaxID=68895 RepID=UPI00114793E2|nr:hypothetical protein [Cupriavidus basilensis]
MENSIFVPLHAVPSGLNEIINFITSGFSGVGGSVPNIYSSKSSYIDKSWKYCFVFVKGIDSGEKCWVSFCETTPDVTGDDKWTWLAGVTTRGEWGFAGVVAYALCSYADSIVYNDSGALTGQDECSVEELKTILSSY